MRVSVITLFALVVAHATGFCSYPPEMSGLASESMGYHFYKFSISIPKQRAIFRTWTDPISFIYLDYKLHRKSVLKNGKCRTFPIDESLELLPGPPDDAEILSEVPPSPNLPRTVTFRSKNYTEIYVAVDLMRSSICYPLGMPYVRLTPTRRLADHYNVRREVTNDTSRMNPDLSSCKMMAVDQIQLID